FAVLRIRALPSFPTRRSSDLGGFLPGAMGAAGRAVGRRPLTVGLLSRRRSTTRIRRTRHDRSPLPDRPPRAGVHARGGRSGSGEDRKSTRLNSSHGSISYAVL